MSGVVLPRRGLEVVAEDVKRTNGCDSMSFFVVVAKVFNLPSSSEIKKLPLAAGTGN